MAIIGFLHPTEARNAFTNLAYKRFKGNPLYLEKAPVGIFKTDESVSVPSDGPKAPLTSIDLAEATHDDEEMDIEVATLFVKNLNFSTTEPGLANVFKNTPGMKSVKIKMKNDPKNSGAKLSMGFGFIEYDSMKNAKNALKAM